MLSILLYHLSHSYPSSENCLYYIAYIALYLVSKASNYKSWHQGSFIPKKIFFSQHCQHVISAFRSIRNQNGSGALWVMFSLPSSAIIWNNLRPCLDKPKPSPESYGCQGLDLNIHCSGLCMADASALLPSQLCGSHREGMLLILIKASSHSQTNNKTYKPQTCWPFVICSFILKTEGKVKSLKNIRN